MINGIDISDFQGSIDFQKVAASGIKFCSIKATESTGIVMDRYKEYHDGAKAANLLYGMYHFFRGGHDGEEQADNFLSAINGYEGTMLPMVDVEEGSQGGTDRQTYLARLTDFIRSVDATLNGKKMLIYIGYSFWSDFLGGYSGFSGHPCWPAAYSNAANLDMTGTGWSHWTIWQWSSSGNVPGINGNVDLDRLNPSLTLSAISR